MAKRKLVFIGNGMASMKCIEEVIQKQPEHYAITVIGKEKHSAYNRIKLSSILQKTESLAEIQLKEKEWYTAHDITLYKGESVVHIDTNRKCVMTDARREIPYDKLIIATGSSPNFLPIQGVSKKGIYAFRTIDDYEAICADAMRYQRAAVIGGGVLGVEVAAGLQIAGLETTIIHHMERLMQRQLDETAAGLLLRQFMRKGIQVKTNAHTIACLGDERVEGVLLKNGDIVDADLVVFTTGIRPNIQLAENHGIHTRKAIVVNDVMETNIPNIYAIGECAEHKGMVHGLVQPIYEQACVLAKHLLGKKITHTPQPIYSTKLKVPDMPIYSAGCIEHHSPFTSAVTYLDEEQEVYKKFVFEREALAGILFVGELENADQLLQDVKVGRDKSVVMKSLHEKQPSPLDSLKMEDLVCQCQNVTKGAILNSISIHELTNLEEVKKQTGAATGCGGCQELVRACCQLSSHEQTESHVFLCPCTEVDEQTIFSFIKKQQPVNAEEIRRHFQWKTNHGCGICRPAIQYYLEQFQGSVEKISTADQEDMLIPQLYGGRLDLDFLKIITSLLENRLIEQAELTKHKRIRLTGVSKQAAQIVKSHWPIMPNEKRRLSHILSCDCNDPAVTSLVMDLERQVEDTLLPAVTSIHIIGASCSCKLALIDDICLKKQLGEWNIYIGGQLFYTLPHSSELIPFFKALLEEYRKNAYFQESIGDWLSRNGNISIREKLLDEERRDVLCAQFDQSSQGNVRQKDVKV
ncbi:Assimilatory nitrate reductase electron transfer subunit [Bacillus safensis]|uniref:FAD-dependent oxidoreductase n=1 Tax=Bacillus safensis TaxID=561879 RepID=UPI0006A8D712|nr:FAD-dependent oxidoreductase [Bacillus safensis]CUB18493.1 Assimilatory nitrate reductase electron transfer subunit [Bacillus safensis]